MVEVKMKWRNVLIGEMLKQVMMEWIVKMMMRVEEYSMEEPGTKLKAVWIGERMKQVKKKVEWMMRRMMMMNEEKR